MSMDNTPDVTGQTVPRRRFLKAAGASGVAVGLAGCIYGGDGGNGSGTTIQFAADPDLKKIQGKYNDWLHKAGLSKDITVDILAGSSVTDQRQQKYTQWLSANREKPTLLMTDSGWTIPFIARGQLLNLSKNMSDTAKMVKDEYFEASVNTALGNNGDLYAVPLFPDFPTMQYRKDLVKKAGYDPEGENWATESITWKRFSEITKDVMKKNKMRYGFTFQFKAYEGLSCCDFNEFLSSYGGAYFGPLKNLFGPVGKRPITVDEKPVVDSLRMLRTFIYGENDPHALNGITGGIAPTAVLQWTEDPSLKPFTNGKAVMHRNWPYAININGAEKNFGKDLGVMPIPYGVKESEAKYEGTGGPVAALGGWHAAINPNTQNKEAAYEAVRAMTKEDVQFKLFEEIGWLPPRPSSLSSKRAKQVPVMGRYLEQLRIAGENAISRPVTVVWPQESAKIAQQANGAVGKNGNPKKAMTQLKSQLEQIESSVEQS
jgi:ABC-type glycerol-3-phosphate transport system substrate-binding protein